MKANIISLKKDVDRRAKITTELNKYGFDFEVFDAIDKYSSKSTISELKIKSISNLSSGEIGCALSHLSIYSKNKDKYIFILEDDVSPIHQNPLKNIFKLPIDQELKDGEILLLGLTTKKEWVAYKKVKKKLGLECMELDYLSIPMLRGACSYLINKNTAKKIIELQALSLNVADAWWHFKKEGVLNNFYYYELFSHPIATANQSNLENERQEKIKKKSLLNSLIKKIVYNGLKVYRLFAGVKYVQQKPTTS